jgi:hypothetical protein
MCRVSDHPSSTVQRKMRLTQPTHVEKKKEETLTLLLYQNLRRRILAAHLLPLQQLRHRIKELLRLGAIPERDVAPCGDEVVGCVRPAVLLITRILFGEKEMACDIRGG